MDYQYICQVRNGIMLAKNENSQLELVATGYPYPDTPKSNLLMMQDLIEQECHMSVDEEYLTRNFHNIVDYLEHCYNFENVPTMQGITASIYLEPDMFFGHEIIRLHQRGNYYVMLTDKGGYDRFIVVIDVVEFNRYGLGCKESDKALQRFYKDYKKDAHDTKDMFCDSLESFKAFLDVIVDVVEESNKGSFSFCYDKYGFAEMKSVVISSYEVVMKHIGTVLYDIMCKHIKQVYQVVLNISDLRKICSFLDCETKFASKSYVENTKFHNLLVICLDRLYSNSSRKALMSTGLDIVENDLLTTINSYCEYVIVEYAKFIYNTLQFQDDKFICNIKDKLEGHRGYIGEFYVKSKPFMYQVCRDNMTNFDALVSDTNVVWDMTRYFDERAVKLSGLAVDRTLVREVEFGSVKDLVDKNILELLICMREDIDERIIVFNNELYERLKQYVIEAFLLYNASVHGEAGFTDDNKYYIKFPSYIHDILGEFNLLARVLAYGSNLNALTDNYHVGVGAKNTIKISFTFGDSYKISADYFNKYLKGACIINFLTFGYKSFLHSDTIVSLDRIKIAYNETTQSVEMEHPYGNLEY